MEVDKVIQMNIWKEKKGAQFGSIGDNFSLLSPKMFLGGDSIG